MKNNQFTVGAFVFGAALGVALPAARAEKVGQHHLGATYQNWRSVSLTSGGTSMVTFDQPDRRRRFGSLEQVLPEPGTPDLEAAVEIISEDAILLPGEGLKAFEGGFGLLRKLRHAKYRWYRDSASTSAPFLASAFRLMVYDPDDGPHGSTWYLVYDQAYDGYLSTGVPEDQWVESNVANAVVWRSPLYLNGQKAPDDYCANNVSECYRWDRTPQDWGFGPRAMVIGLRIQAGSGWQGTYRGFVDNVRLKFAGRRAYRWNFEPI